MLKEKFVRQFGRPAEMVCSAPGRTELGGNHTDHQRGRVLAAAVELDTRAAVAKRSDGRICLVSEGFDPVEIDLCDLAVRESESGTTAALVRGMAAAFRERGVGLTGFDACVASSVPPGSGLSSSAAFEVLLGVIINELSGAALPAAELARMGQWAENVYFGKPCGLMDQMASAVGGVVEIDFADPAAPAVTPVPFDFSACGHALCIVDTGASHADLTEEYAAIPAELKQVAAFFGKEVLCEVEEEAFYARLSDVRAAAGDRAVLRAMHVFAENRRVTQQAEALRRGDFDAFLRLVAESGRSSRELLQNVVPAGNIRQQEVALAISLAERLLQGRGAVRVHGGGFAGTVQAFVPNGLLEQFRSGMEQVLGAGSVRVMDIRPAGGRREE